MNSWIDQVAEEDNLDEKEIEYLIEKQFVKPIKLQSVILYPDGSMEFCYEDGGIFFGHYIIVKANMEDGPIGSYLEG